MARQKPSDLSPVEFRNALVDNGFAYLGRSVDRYVDIRHRRPGRYLEPVKNAKKRILRRETFAALLAWRAEAEAEKAAAMAVAVRHAAVASAIAPRAAPVARASLTDPAAAVAQLADDFVIHSTRAEGVVRGDLILIGWLPAQLDDHAEAARLLAYRKQEGVAG